MNLLFTSDLHGNIRLYREIKEAALSHGSEAIVLGGDLLPSFAPTRRYEDMISHQRDFIHVFLLPFFHEMIKETSVRLIFTLPGNWDLGYDHLFTQPLDGLVDIDRKCHSLEGNFELIGYPFVPPTPFRPKEYEKMDDLNAPWPPQKNPSYICSHDQNIQIASIEPETYLRAKGTISDDLRRLVTPLDFKRTVYVMHSAPYETTLDRIHAGGHAGSRSIKAFIESHQPLLTLHGHIHESAVLSGSYVDRIGETISVNPGQSFFAGNDTARLDAITFELERIAETLFHTSLS